MKKIYMTMVALLCGVAAMAQNEVLLPEKIEVAAGDKADLTVGFDVTPAGDEALYLSAFSFKIQLPEGFALTTHEERKFVPGQGMVVSEVFDNELFNIQDHTATIQPVKVGDDYRPGFYQVTVASLNRNVFIVQQGDIVKVTFQVDETVGAGSYVIEVSDPSGSTWDGVSSPFNKEVKEISVVTSGTGINSINADDANAPIYNVAGQRVSKAQKGVFIQSGKKVAVK